MAPRRPAAALKAPGVEEIVKDEFVRTVAGTEIRLPSLSYMKPGLIRRIRRLGDVDAMYTLLELVLAPKQLEVLDEMDPDDYHEFLDAWREHSGVSLGESATSTS